MSSAETVIRETSASRGSNGDAAPSPQRLSLLDRMDPSIGEASAGIGAMLTELVRRSLRGGVSNIDHHLTEFSEEQVHAALERQLPLVRDVATEIADATSREITQQAVAQLTEETSAKSEEMMTALLETDTRLRQAVTDVDQRVHQSLAETGRKFTDALGQTESQLRDATIAVDSTIRQLEQDTRQTASQLAESLSATRQETNDRLQSFHEELRENARKSWQKINTQFEELRGQTAALPHVADRLSHVESAQRHLTDQIAAHQSQWQSELQEQVRRLTGQLQSALERCSALSSRLEELERPRGISGWFQRLRGGSKKSPAGEEESAGQ